MLVRAMDVTRSEFPEVPERSAHRFIALSLIPLWFCPRLHLASRLAAVKTLLLFIAIAAMSQRVALAGLSGCNVPSPTTYNLGTGTNGLASGGTAQAGCEQVNEQFSNFVYDPNLNGLGGPTAANVSANFAGTSETGGITATFGSGTVWTDSTASNECCAGSGLNFGAAVDTTLGDYAVTSLSLTANSPSLGGGGASPGNISQLNVYLEFCVGSATFNCTNNSPNYGELFFQLVDNQGSGHTADFVCYNNGVTGGACVHGLSSIGSSTTFSINLASYSTTAQGTQTIAIDNLVSYSTSNGDTVSLASLVDTIDETNESPEPSTLFLVGAGLATAWIGRRKLISS